MPIYDYLCSACGRTLEVVHRIHDQGPKFCPECGAEGSMSKAFAPPTIVFKGSGWAKKDRSMASKPAAKKDEAGAGTGASTGEAGSTTGPSTTSGSSSDSSAAPTGGSGSASTSGD